jgi:hypothetical protein
MNSNTGETSSIKDDSVRYGVVDPSIYRERYCGGMSECEMPMIRDQSIDSHHNSVSYLNSNIDRSTKSISTHHSRELHGTSNDFLNMTSNRDRDVSIATRDQEFDRVIDGSIHRDVSMDRDVCMDRENDILISLFMRQYERELHVTSVCLVYLSICLSIYLSNNL